MEDTLTTKSIDENRWMPNKTGKEILKDLQAAIKSIKDTAGPVMTITPAQGEDDD